MSLRSCAAVGTRWKRRTGRRRVHPGCIAPACTELCHPYYLLRREESRDEGAGALVLWCNVMAVQPWRSDRQRPSLWTCLGKKLDQFWAASDVPGHAWLLGMQCQAVVHRHVYPGRQEGRRLLVSKADYDCTQEIQTFPLAANTDPWAREQWGAQVLGRRLCESTCRRRL